MTQPPPGTTSVDAARYPLQRRDLAAYLAAVDPLMVAMGSDGHAVVDGLIRAEVCGALAEEAERLAPLGHRDGSTGVRVASDVFGAGSPLRALYDSDAMREFVADLAGGPVFRAGDPLAGLNVVVLMGGDRLVTTEADGDLLVAIVLRAGRCAAASSALPVRVGDAVVVDTARVVLAVEPIGDAPALLVTMPFHRRADHRPADGVVLARYGRIGSQRRR